MPFYEAFAEILLYILTLSPAAFLIALIVRPKSRILQITVATVTSLVIIALPITGWYIIGLVWTLGLPEDMASFIPLGYCAVYLIVYLSFFFRRERDWKAIGILAIPIAVLAIVSQIYPI